MALKQKGDLEYNDNTEVNVSSPAFFICLHQLRLHNKNVNNNGKLYEAGIYD
ncbi:hypothetical protein Bca101_084070 [Brassica carinata]